MTAPAVTVEVGESLVAAAKLLDAHGVKRLPVVDASGQLIGVVSRADLLKMHLRTDQEIHDDITADVLHKTLWIDPRSVAVTVIGGKVDLRGNVERKTAAMLVAHLCAAVPGVIEVHDNLLWDFDDTKITNSVYFRSHPFSAEFKQ